jgi:hypothetical protein
LLPVIARQEMIGAFKVPATLSRSNCSACEQTFDFFDQDRQMGPIEADVWRWNAMAFDVGWHMLMVRKTAGQAGVGGVFLGIVPA